MFQNALGKLVSFLRKCSGPIFGQSKAKMNFSRAEVCRFNQGKWGSGGSRQLQIRCEWLYKLNKKGQKSLHYFFTTYRRL